MSNIQGEAPTTRRGKIVAAIVGGVVSLALIAGAIAFVSNVQANAAAHTQLMAGVKIDGHELGSAAKEDQQLAAHAVEASEIQHVNAIAAQQTAARVAAEQAAQAAAAQAAAQQAAAAEAERQAAESQQTPSDDGPSDQGSPAPAGLPSGSPVPSPNGYYDTTLCASGSASTINGVPTCD